MHKNSSGSRLLRGVVLAVVEVGFIVFLFYSNLLMGEFTSGKGEGKSLMAAMEDVVTGKNFAIAIVTAIVGFVVFEFFRKRLQD